MLQNVDVLLFPAKKCLADSQVQGCRLQHPHHFPYVLFLFCVYCMGYVCERMCVCVYVQMHMCRAVWETRRMVDIHLHHFLQRRSLTESDAHHFFPMLVASKLP